MTNRQISVFLSLGVLANASIAMANVTWNIALFMEPEFCWTIPATLVIETPAFKSLAQLTWGNAALLTLKINLVSFLIGMFLFLPLPNLLYIFFVVFVGNVLIESIALNRWQPSRLSLRNAWIIVVANGLSSALPFLQWSLMR